MTGRVFRGDDVEPGRERGREFDPVAEGRRYGLAPEVSSAIWEYARRGSRDSGRQLDEPRARERFHEVAARIAARGGALVPDVGRQTHAGVEHHGETPRARSSRVLAPPVPGRTTRVITEARRWAHAAGQSTEAPGDAVAAEEALPALQPARLNVRGAHAEMPARPGLEQLFGSRVVAIADHPREAAGEAPASAAERRGDDAAAVGSDRDRSPLPRSVVDLVSRATAVLGGPGAPVRMDRHARERTDAHRTSAVMAGGTILLHPERFDPTSSNALEIVMHELVHVAQLRVDARAPERGAQDAEHEAHRLARQAVAGGPREQPRVRLTALEAAHGEDRQPATNPIPAPPAGNAVQPLFGVTVEMTPAIAPGEPAIVGMTLQFNIRRDNPHIEPTLFVEEWQLRYPSGHLDWSPSVEVTRFPITEAGAYTLRATVIAQRGPSGDDRMRFPIEQHFTAVSAESRAQWQLPGVADDSYEGLRGPLDIQHALLRPPGPAQQASGDYRIDAAAPNPAAATDRGPPLVFSIARAATTPPSGPTTYHWYARPLNRETLSCHRDRTRALGNLRSATLDGQPGFFDLGTGATAELVSDQHNVFIILCRVLDAGGRRVSEARYVQTVLDDRERRDLDKLESYLERSTTLAGQLSPATRTPLTAVHVGIDSAASTRLQLFAGPTPGGIVIIDVTPGLDPKQHQLEFQGATFEAALESFRARNHHARGSIRLRVPADNHLGPRGAAVPASEHTFETTGETQLEAWSGRLGLASMVLLAGAVVAAPFTAGGSVVVTLLLIGSAATGVVAAGLSLAERVQHAEISSTGVALDIIGIVTSIVGAAAAFRGLRAASHAVNVAGQASRFVLWSNFVASGVAAVLVSVESVEQIQQILGDDSLSPDQRRGLLVRVVASMALNGAMVALSYRDLASMRGRLAGVLGAELEGALGHEARLTLSLLDEGALQALRGPSARPATVAEVTRLVAILRADPGLVRRLAGRSNLLEALRLARGDTSDALELGLLRVRLAPAVGAKQAERIASALERSGLPGAAAHDLGDHALARISSDPERAGALYRQYGDGFLAQLRAHPGDTLDAITGRLAHSSPRAAAAGAGVFDLTNTRALHVTGDSGATSTTVDGNLGPSHLNSDLRRMAGRPRAHGATVTFEPRAGGATQTTGHITLESASGAAMTIDVEVRATSNLETPGGAAGPEPSRLELRPPDPAARRASWQATVTLSNRLQREDIPFAVGRELDEAIDICRRNQRGIVASEQQGVAFRPGAPMVAGAAQTSAADRAALHQLQELWADLSPRQASLAGHDRAGTATVALREAVHERVTRIQRLLRTMGLEDPARFAERLPLLRSMGMPEAEWKPMQVMVEQGAFGALSHPGLTATQPVITSRVIDHLLHPGPRTGRDFILNGLDGGHQTANISQFVVDHPNYALVHVRSMSSGATTYHEYRQYRWKSTATAPPPIGDPHRPGGAAFGPAEQAMWDVANVPKTTADGLQPYLREAEAAWERWRSAGFNPGPPPSGPATHEVEFKTPPNAAGVAFEGGFQFNPGPPPTWSLTTIYPKL